MEATVEDRSVAGSIGREILAGQDDSKVDSASCAAIETCRRASLTTAATFICTATCPLIIISLKKNS